MGQSLCRATSHIEKFRGEREAIIVTEIPYQVNKATMIEKISELVREKRIEGISAMRDESDRRGMRVVIEIKRDSSPDVVLNQLYKYTPMQTPFSANMLALVERRPIQMTARAMLEVFLRFPRDCYHKPYPPPPNKGAR